MVALMSLVDEPGSIRTAKWAVRLLDNALLGHGFETANTERYPASSYVHGGVPG
jgi:hypothetical protein